MSATKRKSVDGFDNYDQQPTQSLFTEADVLVKRLASKQTKTHIELTTELRGDNRFVSLAYLDSINNYREGTCSAADLQNQCKHLEDLEKLKSAGLPNSDIQFYIDYKLSRRTRYKNLENNAYQERVDRIEGQIKAHSIKIVDESKLESVRQNILLLEKPSSVETRLLDWKSIGKIAYWKNEKPKKKISHPMDDIKTIETSLFDHLNDNVDTKAIRSKTRKLRNKISKLECALESKTRPHNIMIDRKTNWDVYNPVPDNSNKLIANRVHTCATRNCYTVRNGEIIKLNNTNTLSPQDSKDKLTVEDIKKLPKFSNYEIGTPTKILYIQNLANSTTENDLKIIFKIYEANISSYKVLTGRLKGRGFIAFVDDLSCTAALEELNGIFVKNKPMIFQYGKRVD